MPTTTVVTVVPPLFDEAKLAVAGFLARYSGPTRVSHPCDLRQWFTWCHQNDLPPFAVRRGHLEWPERSTWRRVSGRRGRSFWSSPGCGSTATPRPGSCAAWPRRRGSPSQYLRTRCVTRSSRPPWTPGCHYGTSRSPPGTPTRARPPATTAPGTTLTATPATSSPHSSPAPRDTPDGVVRPVG